MDEVVRELKGRDTTVVMATHQVEHVSGLADQVLMLEAGRVC